MSFAGHEWTDVSPAAKDLICSLLKADPIERIDTADALVHAFIIENEHNSNPDTKVSIPKSNRIHRILACQVRKFELTQQISLY